MVGRDVAQYRVVKRLGQGAMGEVWLAEDTSLGRKVALKFLAEWLRDDSTARRRFLHESRAAAALDHPFICKVYEAGEARGEPYIAMEYVEGKTLHRRLREGPLPLGEALQASGEIAEALDTAHRRGIVHRDLKPANVFLTDQGHVKVVDFGLAKRIGVTPTGSGDPTRSASSLTGGSHIPGTVAYMAPEQLLERGASPQSDIFSLGIMLYEMLAGVHPFLRASSLETAEAVLRHTPPPLSTLRDDIPALVEHTVTKMLSKDPRQRYRSVHEVSTNLLQLLPQKAWISGTHSGSPRRRTVRSARIVAGLFAVAALAISGWTLIQLRPAPDDLTTAPAGPVGASIAVLPFADMSPEGNLAYFCDGLVEQTISTLAASGQLRVTARTSAFALRDKSLDVRQIGEQLGVEKLLEGSVRRLGETLRITVQLVSAADGFHLWSKDYDRQLKDTVQVQEEIARDVLRALEVEVTAPVAAAAGTPSTSDAEAYDLYLRGRYLWNKRTEVSLKAAIEKFKNALDRDPDFALAYVGLADAYGLLESYGALPPSEATTLASQAANQALRLDDRLAEAHASLGYQLQKQWDWAGAERELSVAIELKPGYATARSWYALLLAQLGRSEQAIAEIGRVRRTDPLSSHVQLVEGTVFYLARRYDEAARRFESTIEMEPDSFLAYEGLAYVQAMLGMNDLAVATALGAAERIRPARPSEVLGYVYGRAGREEDAREVLTRLIDAWSAGRGSPARIAVVYLGLEEWEEALRWLEAGRREQDIWLAQLGADPVFDPLRSEPRFERLLAEVHLTR